MAKATYCASIILICFQLLFNNCYCQHSFKCPQRNGQYADAVNCHIFYQCDNNISYRQFCPPGSKYDGARHQCVNRHEKVKCGPQPTTEPPPTTTPDPNAAPSCDPASCHLPACFCSESGIKIPGNLPKEQTPQMIMITFDGAINHLNFDTYNTIFLANRTNPNGCEIRGTFFMTHEYSDYSKVQELYSRGHEMAVASVSRRQGLEDGTHEDWVGEMVTMREILFNFASINPNKVTGMRAPHIKPGRNTQYEVLYDYNFLWDSSMVVPPKKVPVWPYTLDYKSPHECKSGTCPTGSFPGIWELPLNSHYMDERYEGGYCPYLDQCGLHHFSVDEIVEFLTKDFHRHYDNNRAPYMISVSVNWFTTAKTHKALLNFIDYTLTLPGVYYTTVSQAIEWMTDPQPLNDTPDNFSAFKCSNTTTADKPCNHPTSCPLILSGDKIGVQEGTGGTRYLTTCTSCPSTYPWIFDSNGIGRGHKDTYQ